MTSHSDHFSVWLLVILISESVLLVSCCQTLNSIVSFLITAYAFGVLRIWHAFAFWITLNRFFQSIQSFLNNNVTHQVIIVPSIENASKQYCWCNTVFINLYTHMWRIHIWLLFGYLVIWLFGYLFIPVTWNYHIEMVLINLDSFVIYFAIWQLIHS